MDVEPLQKVHITQVKKEVAPILTEAETEAAMGLRPVIVPAPTAKKAPTPAPPADDEEPMPPPVTIEPELPGAIEPTTEPEVPKTSSKKPTMPPVRDTLDQDSVNEIGRVLQGHFVDAANWMIKQGWIPASTQPIKTEAHAGLHLQHTLPMLTKARAKKILTQKLAFMRAIEEINP
jgi:hypothetical protein